MFYSAIINTKSIEIDYSDEDGDFQEEMKRVIKHNTIEGKSFFVEHMGYTFSFLNDGKYTYACIANPDVDKGSILEFLQHLQEEFAELTLNEREHFHLKATQTLKQLMTKHKKDFQTGDKFDLIERELDDLEKEKRNILTVTLEKEICMEALINKSNKLKDNSNTLKFFTRKTLKKNKSSYLNFYCVGLFLFIIFFVYLGNVISLRK